MSEIAKNSTILEPRIRNFRQKKFASITLRPICFSQRSEFGVSLNSSITNITARKKPYLAQYLICLCEH